MMKTALVYDVRTPEARETAIWLKAHGYQVIEKTDEDMSELKKMKPEQLLLDMVVIKVSTDYHGADGPVGTEHDYCSMADFVSRKINSVRELIEACIPFLQEGQGKRIAILTEPCSSISCCDDNDAFAKHMILAGINMLSKLFFNALRPKGFTMRCYITDPQCNDGGICAGEYICMNFCFDSTQPFVHSDENRFIMRDRFFRERPW
jgi:hypothetical protein